MQVLYRQAKSATAAAGITCVVSQSSVIGQLARAGGENILGTLLGGSLGFGVYVAAHTIAEVSSLPELLSSHSQAGNS